MVERMVSNLDSFATTLTTSNSKRTHRHCCTGTFKRRVAAEAVSRDEIPMAVDVVDRRKKLKESPESSDEEPLVIGGKKPSHLTQVR